MRPFYEILQMIQAHYSNDDAKFESYARAIIDFYNKDGNIQGVNEIIQIMTTGRITPRTDIPRLVSEEDISPFAENMSTSEQTKPTKTVNTTKTEEKPVVDKADKTKTKKNCKKSARNVTTTKENAKEQKEQTKTPRKKKATKETQSSKQTKRTATTISKSKTKDKSNDKNLESGTPDAPKKRRRRTKAELTAAGYYDRSTTHD